MREKLPSLSTSPEIHGREEIDREGLAALIDRSQEKIWVFDTRYPHIEDSLTMDYRGSHGNTKMEPRQAQHFLETELQDDRYDYELVRKGHNSYTVKATIETDQLTDDDWYRGPWEEYHEREDEPLPAELTLFYLHSSLDQPHEERR